MKILFKTNLDNYQKNCFPDNLSFVPRKGEGVSVTNMFVSHFKDQKLPTTLKVVGVTHTDQGVVCELWYNETDVAFAKLNKINLF